MNMAVPTVGAEAAPPNETPKPAPNNKDSRPSVSKPDNNPQPPRDTSSETQDADKMDIDNPNPDKGVASLSKDGLAQQSVSTPTNPVAANTGPKTNVNGTSPSTVKKEKQTPPRKSSVGPRPSPFLEDDTDREDNGQKPGFPPGRLGSMRTGSIDAAPVVNMGTTSSISPSAPVTRIVPIAQMAMAPPATPVLQPNPTTAARRPFKAPKPKSGPGSGRGRKKFDEFEGLTVDPERDGELLKKMGTFTPIEGVIHRRPRGAPAGLWGPKSSTLVGQHGSAAENADSNANKAGSAALNAAKPGDAGVSTADTAGPGASDLPVTEQQEEGSSLFVTPAPSRASTPAPSRAGTPAPSRASTPVPSRASTPAPSRAGTPAPSRAGILAPSRAGTPAPIVQQSIEGPALGRMATPAPGNRDTIAMAQSGDLVTSNIGNDRTNGAPETRAASVTPTPMGMMNPPIRAASTPPKPLNSAMMERIKAHQRRIAAQKKMTPQPVSKTPSPPVRTSPSSVSHNHSLTSAFIADEVLAHPPISTEVSSAAELEKEDKEVRAKYLADKKYYDELCQKSGGKLPFKSEIEWMRIHSEYVARCRKRKRDEIKEAEEKGQPAQSIDLFPDEGPPISLASSDIENEEEEEDQHGARKRSRPDIMLIRPRTLRQAELESMNVALDAENDRRKKGKDGAGEGEMEEGEDQDPQDHLGSKSKAKKKKSKVSKGKKPKKGTRAAKDWNNKVNQMQSLFRNNVFTDQASEDAPDQPTFSSRNKDKALKELIASVPLEDRKVVKSDSVTLLAATKKLDGRGAAKAVNGMWLIKGMRTALKPYQLLGTSFMRERENSVEEPRGGLMADQMGLGKTLMMLANIVNGRPPKDYPCKTTLLVASPALLTQWAREIQTHVDPELKMSVLKYGHGTRVESTAGAEVLKAHDIILTTYSEVMKSYPKNEPPEELQTAEEKMRWWKETYETNRGVLHRMLFYRVVLDEAQIIKNHTSRTSIACRALMAEHKWALSGTPILNSLTELYPYFKFLGVPHTGSFKIFKNNYCDPQDPQNTERLLVRLAQFMIRRSHADILFGAPILKLPKATPLTHWCEFNDVERNVYDIVQHRFALTINCMAQKGELDKSYGNVLVMLLRLRQMTSHILMLHLVMKDLLELEDIERIRNVVDEISGVAADDARSQQLLALREQLKEKFKAKATDGDEEQAADTHDETAAEATQEEPDSATPHKGLYDLLINTPGNTTINSNPNRSNEQDQEQQQEANPEQNNVATMTGKKFGKEFDFKPYLQSLTMGDSYNRMRKNAKCGSCENVAVDPWVTSCHHVYCADCIEQLNVEAAETEKEHSNCKVCGQYFHYSQRCRDREQEDGDEIEELEGYTGGVFRNTRSKAKEGPVKERFRPEREELKQNWLSLGGRNVLPSAKTIAIKAQVLNWIQENPNVKIIIYTQFLAMIRILGKVCCEEGWGYNEYQGKQSFTARDKAIAEFAQDPEKRILLASLRCGGLGLNLTMASRVIVIDPWWNQAAEQQAFCRVFRIGQVEPTFLTRFCVKNTVDSRLIEMQERKQAEIDEVMEDGGSTVKRLKMKDLMRLFGPVSEDENGKPFILVDDPPASYARFRPEGADHEGFVDDE